MASSYFPSDPMDVETLKLLGMKRLGWANNYQMAGLVFDDCRDGQTPVAIRKARFGYFVWGWK